MVFEWVFERVETYGAAADSRRSVAILCGRCLIVPVMDAADGTASKVDSCSCRWGNRDRHSEEVDRTVGKGRHY